MRAAATRRMIWNFMAGDEGVLFGLAVGRRACWNEWVESRKLKKNEILLLGMDDIYFEQMNLMIPN